MIAEALSRWSVNRAGRRRSPCVTSYARTYKPKTALKSPILGERHNAGVGENASQKAPTADVDRTLQLCGQRSNLALTSPIMASPLAVFG